MKPRALQRLRGGRRRFLLAVIAPLAALLVLAGGAAAYYSYTDSSNGYSAAAAADSLPQGTTPGGPTTTPNPNSNTVSVSFAQASTTGGVAVPASNYQLKRYPAGGGSAAAVTASCSGTGTITCTESSVPDGVWQYTDTVAYGQNWVGGESAESPAVTVDTTAPTAGVAYPVAGTTYGTNWSGAITGTASDATSGLASVKLAIEDTTAGKWWNGTSFSAASASYQTATGTTSWSYALAASQLVSGDSYSVAAQATDAVGNIGTSSTATFTYNTSAPRAAVTYPVSNVTYDGNWTGSITGTAGSNAGAGTSITTAAVAIEDATAGKWWNGTSFSAASASYQTATGTTSWSYALAASNLTNGHTYTVAAQATDSVGNLGASSVITFLYNTTHPSVATTYPVNNVTYDGNWAGSITGTASSNAGAGTSITTAAVAVEDTTAGKWWDGGGFSATTQTFVAATGTTSWSYALAASVLTSGHSYTVIAQATDSAGNVGTSPTSTFTYNTSHPSVAVAYPVASTTYGANWTGSITGTAASNSGAGTSITTAAVAIEDTTASKWWDGSGFNATTQTFVAATGTTSWSYALAASNLTSGHSYSVIGEATDSIGNLGTSSTVTFTYSTTAPSVVVSYPVNSTTYGANWTGTITGTGVTNAGSATISSAAVAIEDMTTSQWWNGSSFTATSASYQSAAGTTSWSYPLAASNLTSGHSYSLTAQTTDSAGNVGTSTSVAFTYSAVSVLVLAQGAPTSASQSFTISNVTSVAGATDLIAVYCFGGSACGSTGSKVTVPTGTGTPFSSASTATIEAIVSSSNPKSCLELIQATGNGSTGSVTVDVGSGYDVGWVSVLQLSAGATVKATKVNPATQTSSSTATATLPTPVANAEIALLGITDGTGSTTVTPPTGMTLLGTYQHGNGTAVNGGSDLGMYFDPVAQPSASFGLSASVTWGTIAIQVG